MQIKIMKATAKLQNNKQKEHGLNTCKKRKNEVSLKSENNRDILENISSEKYKRTPHRTLWLNLTIISKNGRKLPYQWRATPSGSIYAGGLQRWRSTQTFLIWSFITSLVQLFFMLSSAI